MSVVTLTTDFGLKDYYSARIKGAILSQAPGVTLIDISHNIPNYDIVQAAFIFRNAWEGFPPGTIHLISVNDLDKAADHFVLVSWKAHFFIAPDNGVLPLVIGDVPIRGYALDWPQEPFPVQALFARTIAALQGGVPPEELGERVDALQKRLTFQPVTSKNQIRGTVIYINHYDNVIINIRKALFEDMAQNRSFALYFKRNDPITRISRKYADVPVGDPLCRFNSAGFLEIAIHMGKAASLFGLKIDDTIQVDFIDS